MQATPFEIEHFFSFYITLKTWIKSHQPESLGLRSRQI